MQPRGTQSRRARSLADDEGRPSRSSGLGGGSFWPALAIAAIIVATAGWTIVAVMLINGPSSGVATATDTPNPSESDVTDPSDAPYVERHDFVDLEALLPSKVGDAAFTIESWAGNLEEAFPYDPASLDPVLTAAGKTEDDVQLAIGYDETASVDLAPGVMRVDGITGQALLDANITAFKAAYDTFTTKTIKVGDRTVTRGSEGEDPYAIYWYAVDGYLFSVTTEDELIARDVLANLSDKPYPSSPVSAPPTTLPSVVPSEAPSASASAS